MASNLTTLSIKSKIISVVGLAILAVLGNYFFLNWFSGVSIIFGSIAVMLAVVFLNTASVVLIALAGGLATLFFWGHPYALVILVLEALVVSQLYRRGISNLVMADFVYWLIIGLPLVLLSYHQLLGMEWQASLLIGLKQSLNGLFNALIAGSILICIQYYLRSSNKNYGLQSLRLSNLLFHIFMMCILLTEGAFSIFESSRLRDELEIELVQDATKKTDSLIRELKVNLESDLRPYTETNMALAIESNGSIRSSVGEIASNSAPANEIIEINATLSKWESKDLRLMQSIKGGVYIVRIPISNNGMKTNLIIEVPAKPLVDKLEYKGLILLVWMSLYFILGILISHLLSHLLTRGLKRIEKTSQVMSTQIARGEDIIFPKSLIQEYENLTASMKKVSDELAKSFVVIRANEQSLEDNVSSKTEELRESKAHLTLAIEGSGYGLWNWNLDTNDVYFSPLWFEMLGYPKDAFPHNFETFTKLLHPDDTASVLEQVKDFIEGKVKN